MTGTPSRAGTFREIGPAVSREGREWGCGGSSAKANICVHDREVEANLSIGEEGLGAGVIAVLQLEGGHLILELDTVLLGPLYVLLVERLQSMQQQQKREV